jgi:hypothetical protein
MMRESAAYKTARERANYYRDTRYVIYDPSHPQATCKGDSYFVTDGEGKDTYYQGAYCIAAFEPNYGGRKRVYPGRQ